MFLILSPVSVTLFLVKAFDRRIKFVFYACVQLKYIAYVIIGSHDYMCYVNLETAYILIAICFPVLSSFNVKLTTVSF